jgi:hypothetical protein
MHRNPGCPGGCGHASPHRREIRQNLVDGFVDRLLRMFDIGCKYNRGSPGAGFTPLSPLYWPILILTLLGYMSLTQVAKEWLLRKQWI